MTDAIVRPAVAPIEATSRQIRTTAVRIVILLLMIALVVPVGVVALGSGTGLIAPPYQMFELAGRAPLLFPAHMISSALALLLTPLVVGLRHRPEFHRPLGFLLGAFVVIGGLTALPVAVMSHSTFIARLGFFSQGLVWLGLLAAAFAAIRTHNIRRHARMMIAMLAVTSGAIWFRVITGTAIALGLPFEPVYAAAAWMGWTLPLVIVMQNPTIVSRFLAR